MDERKVNANEGHEYCLHFGQAGRRKEKPRPRGESRGHGAHTVQDLVEALVHLARQCQPLLCLRLVCSGARGVGGWGEGGGGGGGWGSGRAGEKDTRGVIINK